MFVNALIRLCAAHGGFRSVAKAADVNPQTIYQITSGVKLPSGNPKGVGPQLRKKLDAAFPGWLDAEGNVSTATVRGSVPLISWVQAGHLGEAFDMNLPGEAEEWVETYESTPQGRSFALRVQGDSMTSPHPGETSFPDGCIVIVDPDRACHAGDFVIAKDVTTQKATFKRLVSDGGRWYLKPLNPTFPTLEIDDPALRVIGRVIEMQIRRKL